ncbi:MAG: adenylyltransferase/cytidyltransferase family protein [Bacteroidetes bacterium]|nr:adenylyltransferase/cytidyltransferase family protein [Bacteroidota bacterium]MDA0903380.1 adenylyltransferase/cytidyltransferase family protein [Bacteroidota bacterium]MDA1241588.1 adenylyltransferase/cytidyltransferase family protein [Bacteroidota bacterium]
MAESMIRFDLREASKAVEGWRAAGGKVVLTNGVFDVLHVGHLAVLQAAAQEGDRLVVAVNTDASVRRLNKGEDRPIHPQWERASMLAALRCVDAVVLFDEDTPIEIVRALRPDVLVKGGDYNPDERNPQDPTYMVGSGEVKSWGGRAVSVPLLPGHSTTQILNKIRGSQPRN